MKKVSSNNNCGKRKMFPEKIGFRSVFAPAIEDDIKEAEAWLNAFEIANVEIGSRRIPKSYVNFLYEWNGGVFSDEVVFKVNESKYGKIKILFGVGPYIVEGLHLCSENNENAERFTDLFPRKFLAIGSGAPLEMVCVSTDGKDVGAVYYCCLDKCSPPSEHLSMLIAKDFLEFWNCLINSKSDFHGNI